MSAMPSDDSVGRQRQALIAALAGVIADGLADDSVSDIIVNSDGAVYFDHLNGFRVRQKGRDLRPDQTLSVILRVANLLGKKQHTDALWAGGILEGELPFYGSRIEAVIPPVSEFPTLAIRKHRRQQSPLTLDYFAMPPTMRALVEKIIDERSNVLIVGGTGSGKTSFLSAMLERVSHVHKDARVITIENVFEIAVVSESKAQLHATGQITQRMLLSASLRLLPDYIIVGEARNDEAIDMIESLTTGHSGMGTTHAHDALEGLMRMVSLTRGDKTPEHVAAAFRYVIEMRRHPPPDGSRYPSRIMSVAKETPNDRFVLSQSA